MTKTESINKIEDYLSQILKETFKYCNNGNTEVSQLAVKINNLSHDAKIILERYKELLKE